MNVKQICERVWKYASDRNFRFLVNADMGMYKNMDDAAYLKKKFECKMGMPLNLENPKTFNEKLQWLKLNDRDPSHTMMVDKYEVKEYVAATLGREYIIPTLGVWDKFEDIDFDKLPDQFVLKCTHDSGGLVIVRDKAKLDVEAARKKINKCLKKNYFYVGREWPYKDVKPRIIAEKLMVDDSGTGLRDYKVLCFEGEPKLIEYHLGRFTSERYQDFYDTQWNKTDIVQVGEKISPFNTPKPELLDQMMEKTCTLAKGLHHVRIDWYISGGQLYFGEITFFDASGFDAFEDIKNDELLGSWITVI